MMDFTAIHLKKRFHILPLFSHNEPFLCHLQTNDAPEFILSEALWFSGSCSFCPHWPPHKVQWFISPLQTSGRCNKTSVMRKKLLSNFAYKKKGIMYIVTIFFLLFIFYLLCFRLILHYNIYRFLFFQWNKKITFLSMFDLMAKR